MPFFKKTSPQCIEPKCEKSIAAARGFYNIVHHLPAENEHSDTSEQEANSSSISPFVGQPPGQLEETLLNIWTIWLE